MIMEHVNSEINKKTYQNHHVFEEIEYMKDFYDSLSFTCFQFIPTGTHGIANYASYVYLALKGTLESIRLSLKSGMITDAYALARKYYDDVLAEIYIDERIRGTGTSIHAFMCLKNVCK